MVYGTRRGRPTTHRSKATREWRRTSGGRPSGSRSLNGEEARTLPHFSQLPPPDPSTRVGPHIADPAPRAALTGQAPAATATSDARSLNGYTRPIRRTELIRSRSPNAGRSPQALVGRRLCRIIRTVRPSPVDRWNGELHSRADASGDRSTRDGSNLIVTDSGSLPDRRAAAIQSC